ncbi:MAG: dihydrodipicolinate synthase family protein [Burkholderiaceae bacterium]|nr:dihydrodipicolinate synthase family protein [Rhodoferax sp.]MCP5259796.1 dihydrodipicolinate synthase family protein [Rhodoferax sp.]
MSLRRALDGISGILVTPFDDRDQLDPAPLQPVVDRAIAAGVHVLVANGNTSEFYGLTAAEAERMVQVAAEQVAGRVPLLAGVGRSVHEACALARASQAAGAAAIMVHQPPDPFVSPRGVVDYVRRIAGAAEGLPLVLYLRNDAIGLAAIEELCALDPVVGVKWASPTPMMLAEAIRRTAGRDIAWVGGLAETWAPPFYAVGARGFTSGLINVFPSHAMAIHRALDDGDYARAGVLIAAMRPFEDLRALENNGTNVTVVKAALRILGPDCGATRPPSAWPLTPSAQEQLVQFMDSAALLR